MRHGFQVGFSNVVAVLNGIHAGFNRIVHTIERHGVRCYFVVLASASSTMARSSSSVKVGMSFSYGADWIKVYSAFRLHQRSAANIASDNSG